MPLPPALAPRMWGWHLVMIVLVAAAIGLGNWQLDAWSAKRDAEARDLSGAEPIALADAFGHDDPFPGRLVGQPVRVSGFWVPAGTFFVSGRAHDGRDGYWVVTPLAAGSSASAPAIPVVRGWAAQPRDPEPPTGRADLVGWLQPPEGSTDVTDDDPSDRVLPELRIADALQFVDQDLYGGYVVDDPARPATNAGSSGLQPADLDALPDAGRFTALRNLLYAIEWWIFGLFALLMWWRFVREETTPPTPTSPTASTPTSATGVEG